MRNLVYVLCSVWLGLTHSVRMNLQMWIQSPTNFIDRSNVPSCVNCRFFIPATDLYYAKCAKFGTKDMVSGVVEHKYASICRDSSNLCREDGRYYEEAPKKDPVSERKDNERE